MKSETFEGSQGVVRNLVYLLKVISDSRLTKALTSELTGFFARFIEAVKLFEFIQKRGTTHMTTPEAEWLLLALMRYNVQVAGSANQHTLSRIKRLTHIYSWKKIILHENSTGIKSINFDNAVAVIMLNEAKRRLAWFEKTEHSLNDLRGLIDADVTAVIVLFFDQKNQVMEINFCPLG